MKIVFFGTDENSLIALKEILNSPHSAELVITVSDKIRTRGNRKTPTPVKKYCVENQVAFVEEIPSLEKLTEVDPDIIVVASYGKIIPDEIINFPKHGALNIHPSLLPKYRGPSPVQTALLNGDQTSGVTIMLLDSGIDTGPIINQVECDIGLSPPLNNSLRGSVPDPRDPDSEHGRYYQPVLKEITEEFFRIGAKMLIEILDSPGLIKSAKIQDHSLATMTKKFTKQDGHINWNQSGEKIINHIRAFGDNIGAYSFLDGKKIKIFDVLFANDCISVSYHFLGNKTPYRPHGTLGIYDGFPIVTVEDGMIVIGQLQVEGKSKISGRAFLRGYKFYDDILTTSYPGNMDYKSYKLLS